MVCKFQLVMNLHGPKEVWGRHLSFAMLCDHEVAIVFAMKLFIDGWKLLILCMLQPYLGQTLFAGVQKSEGKQ